MGLHFFYLFFFYWFDLFFCCYGFWLRSWSRFFCFCGSNWRCLRSWWRWCFFLLFNFFNLLSLFYFFDLFHRLGSFFDQLLDSFIFFFNCCFLTMDYWLLNLGLFRFLFCFWCYLFFWLSFNCWFGLFCLLLNYFSFLSFLFRIVLVSSLFSLSLNS